MSGTAGQDLAASGVPMEDGIFKLDPRDFPIWEAARPGSRTRWPSPWGEGAPGGHLACSALALKSLGDRIDIHTGDIRDVFPHHECEKAQSDGYAGKTVVGAWVHFQPLLVDGLIMSRRSGNARTLADLEAREFEPLAFRYLCLTARFSSPLHFSLRSLRAAQRALLRLRHRVWEWASLPALEAADQEARQPWEQRFQELVGTNLDLPGALALTWDLARSDLPGRTKLEIVLGFDNVLGLGLDGVSYLYGVPEEVLGVVERRAARREEARDPPQQEEMKESALTAFRTAKYEEADEARLEILGSGYVVEDTAAGSRVRPMSPWDRPGRVTGTVSSPEELAGYLDRPDEVDFSIGLVLRNYIDDVCRCVQSALRWAGDHSVEMVAVDNDSTDETGLWLDETSKKDPRIRVVHTDHPLGEAAARNLVFRESRGKTVVLLEPSVEVRGEYLGELDRLLSGENVGLAGPYGLRSGDLKEFEDVEGEGGDVVAVRSQCFAMRRAMIKEVGMMREGFRVLEGLDLDYSLRFRDRGFRVVADPSLPIRRHEGRVWSELGDEEREKRERKNRRRFAARWGKRSDLLVVALAVAE